MVTVISTFAGCGGSSLGYQLAGFQELLAVEFDDNAVETFQRNFPEVPVYHGDIAQLSSEECMSLGNIQPRELDVLDGSPPCQGFSTAGHRQRNDPRNSLFQEYARLLQDLQPKAFVMENVTGLIKGHMKQSYLAIIKTLRECGYRAKGKVLNAKYFGVPQSRERVIIVGIRKDLGFEPSHPKPYSRPIPLLTAIAGADTSGAPWLTDKYKAIYERVPLGGNESDLTGNSGFQNCIRPHPNKPCPTLLKTNTGTGFATMCHPYEPRSLSIGEAKRINSFPDDFEFVGKFQQQWARIGNSVPPNLMRAIATHVNCPYPKG